MNSVIYILQISVSILARGVIYELFIYNIVLQISVSILARDVIYELCYS
jgi:D-serine dehydratase